MQTLTKDQVRHLAERFADCWIYLCGLDFVPVANPEADETTRQKAARENLIKYEIDRLLRRNFSTE